MARRPTRRWISPRHSERASALDTALRFLASRPRSEYEVRQRLRRTGLEDAAIARVLDQLRRHGLLDDEAFAEYWVEQRQTFRPRGARLVRAELAQRGVAASVAENATTSLEISAEEDAYRLASRRARQLRGLDQPAVAARLAGYLSRRGFEWETVKTVVQRVAAEHASG